VWHRKEIIVMNRHLVMIAPINSVCCRRRLAPVLGHKEQQYRHRMLCHCRIGVVDAFHDVDDYLASQGSIDSVPFFVVDTQFLCTMQCAYLQYR